MKENRHAYIYGNAVRETIPVPEPRETDRRKKSLDKEHKFREAYKKRHNTIVVVQKMVVVMGVLAMGFFFVLYLQAQTELTSRKNNVSNLQTELMNLKEENDAIQSVVDRQVNLEYIKVRAMELGMVYPQDAQVIEYKSNTSNYIVQHKDIPENGISK